MLKQVWFPHVHTTFGLKSQAQKEKTANQIRYIREAVQKKNAKLWKLSEPPDPPPLGNFGHLILKFIVVFPLRAQIRGVNLLSNSVLAKVEIQNKRFGH